MKTFLSTLCIILIAVAAIAGNPKPSKPIEMIVSSRHVQFYAADPRRMMQLLVRNVGEETIEPNKILTGLSIVWDGKEYQKNPNSDSYITTEGPPLLPRCVFEGDFSPFDFLIPQKALSSGWHTFVVRTGDVHSNKVSIFIEVKK